MSAYTDHRGIKKKLKGINERANRGNFSHQDYQTLLGIVNQLVNAVYKPLIEEERMQEAQIRLEREMDEEWEG